MIAGRFLTRYEYKELPIIMRPELARARLILSVPLLHLI
jgi:hypothetical protein